ncbi:uncharacterized protein Z519_06910 [Cladophialophora bantiana CBS 173.52]|uniref:Hypervirulence associated protein TUDOR domain-containing protein n=1 Tax=Cladophialophora bantiana (strain ATCC 10958 / CBS 173.52 / CDC B-1940 / NIH 8579) TaxID=1442370 RepID=A0A0D2HQH8_CLAB1|nr:uncharacterized protein Z519_06910 [Cladophialophora bantiana CBS 173.52]KIW93060.1 hypothetical protein Z519_06910 [Cladophialophora bantiana CBS 173.52]
MTISGSVERAQPPTGAQHPGEYVSALLIDESKPPRVWQDWSLEESGKAEIKERSVNEKGKPSIQSHGGMMESTSAQGGYPAPRSPEKCASQAVPHEGDRPTPGVSPSEQTHCGNTK